jgi:hypothetical protein
MREHLATDVAKAVYDLLVERGVEQREMHAVVDNVARDFARAMTAHVDVDERWLNTARDVVWFSMEREDGDDSLNSWGRLFPGFMSFGGASRVIPAGALPGLTAELDEIRRRLANADLVDLTGKAAAFRVGAPVWIHAEGHARPNADKSSVIHCRLHGPLAAHPEERIRVESMLTVLRDACLDAHGKGVDLQVEFH